MDKKSLVTQLLTEESFLDLENFEALYQGFKFPALYTFANSAFSKSILYPSTLLDASYKHSRLLTRGRCKRVGCPNSWCNESSISSFEKLIITSISLNFSGIFFFLRN